MEKVYINIFTGTERKFIYQQGYVLVRGEWVKNGISEELIKSLPYYKVQ